MNDRFGMDQFQKSSGVDDTTVNPSRQCRKHRAADSVIPRNVSQAVNFHQSKGLTHCSSQVLVADPTHTKILGGFGLKLRS
jgi:hypothetical protein